MTNTLFPSPAGFTGWTRPANSRGRWHRVCEAATERECNRLLEAATAGRQHKAVYVGRSDVNPNAKPSWARR